VFLFCFSSSGVTNAVSFSRFSMLMASSVSSNVYYMFLPLFSHLTINVEETRRAD
jgi:hypothetical protein